MSIVKHFKTCNTRAKYTPTFPLRFLSLEKHFAKD